MSTQSRAPSSQRVPDDRDRVRLDPDNPYPGPASFEESHSAFFFGRATEAAALFARVARSPLTVLYAKSGLGKTSLLQAGLFPRLRRAGYVPVPVRFTFPGENNLEPPKLIAQVRTALTSAITRGDLDGAEPTEVESLWAYLSSTSFWDAQGEPAVPVLVLDQFEEVFTLGGAVRDQLDELVVELSDLVEDRIPTSLRRALESRERGAKLPPPRDRPPAKVLIALREDFLGSLDRLAPKLPSLGAASNRFPLDPLTYDSAMQAVLEPAKARSLIGRDAADQLVRAVAEAPKQPTTEIAVESALLALYCHELNEKRIAAGMTSITRELVEANKSIILDGFYERCLAAVSSLKRTLVQRLVEEKLLIAGRRHIYPMAALNEIRQGKVVLLDEDVRPLIDRRLLRKEPRLGEDYLELIHDVLINAVEKRKRARKEEEASRALRRTIGKFGLGVASVLVLIGGALVYAKHLKQQTDEAEVWRKRKSDVESEIKVAKGNASAKEPEVRTAMAALDWSKVARTMASAYEPMVKARAARLGAKRDEIEIDEPEPEPGPLLALLSNRFRASKGDERILRTADRDPESPRGLVLSEDGSRGAVVLGDRNVRLFDAATSWKADDPGTPTLDHGPLVTQGKVIEWFAGRIERLLLSGDGSRLFGVGRNGEIVVWDAKSGHRLLGFRTDIGQSAPANKSTTASLPTIPQVQVDRSGERVLLWNQEANRALVISLRKEITDGIAASSVPATGIDLASKSSQRSAPSARLAWVSSRWATLMMTLDGKRVVGTWSQSSSEDRPGRTDVHVWNIEEAEVKAAVGGGSEEFAVAYGALSHDGAFLATTSTKGVHLWTLGAQSVSRPQQLLPYPSSGKGLQLIGFDDSAPSLFVNTDGSLFAWDVSRSERNPLPDHEGYVDGARLFADGQRALVYSSGLVERYDVATGRLVSDFIPGRPTNPGDVRLGADSVGVAWSTKDDLRVRPFSVEASRDRYLSGMATDWKQATGSPVIVDNVLGQFGEDVLYQTPGVQNGISRVSLKSSSGERPVEIRGAASDSVRIFMASGRVALLNERGDLYVGSSKGNLTRVLRLQDDEYPTVVALSSDGRWVAAAVRSAVWLWDEQAKLKLSGEVPLINGARLQSVAVASEGTDQAHLVAADRGGHVFSARTSGGGISQLEDPAPQARSERSATTLAIAPTGDVAMGASDGSITLWDSTGRLHRGSASSRPGSKITDLRFVKNGTWLVSASSDGLARVWDGADGALRCTMRDLPDGARQITVESGEGERIVSSGHDDAVVWSAGDCTASIRFDDVYRVGFVPGGQDRFFLSSRKTGMGTVVEARGGADVPAEGPRGQIGWGAFAGNSTVIAGDAAGQLFSWEIGSVGKPPVRLGDPLPGTPLVVQTGDRIVALLPRGALTTIDSRSKAESTQLPMDPAWIVRGITLTDGGGRLFAVESSKGTLRARRFSGPLFGEASKPISLSPGPGCKSDESLVPEPLLVVAMLDGAPMVLAIEKTCLRMWSEEGNLVLEKPWALEGDPTSAALSPAKHHLAIALDNGFAFWELTKSKGPSVEWNRSVLKLVSFSDLLPSSKTRERTRTISFHPEGRFMVTVSTLGLARLWEWDEAASDVYLLAPLEPNQGLSWARFSPDGDKLITGGKQGRIKIWDMSTRANPEETLRWLQPWLPKRDSP